MYVGFQRHRRGRAGMFLDEASRMQNFRQVGTKASGQLKKGAADGLQNELPGPGAYYKPPSMVVTHAKSGSVSKKGMGTGFVSKVTASTASILTSETSCTMRDSVPGPGEYNASAFDAHVDKGSRSAFASRTNRGPGAYGVEAAERCLRSDTTAQAQASSMFKRGTADRFGHSLERKADVFNVPGT
ncbi:hypothetical protein DYB26_009499 [Aphanomyces astaci]|uniref:Uncharacterized protein n=1 Tax=Aphanomyces astaci TaxID=112090 RepID=A0A3R7DW31_APHAT|nr:hypothetical protein DYB26_009499 [Aphanomyces astaci]